MKLSQYAKKVGVTYKTAYCWYRAGTLDAYQTATGLIIVREKADERPVIGRIALYALGTKGRLRTADAKAQGLRCCQRLSGIQSGDRDCFWSQRPTSEVGEVTCRYEHWHDCGCEPRSPHPLWQSLHRNLA